MRENIWGSGNWTKIPGVDGSKGGLQNREFSVSMRNQTRTKETLDALYRKMYWYSVPKRIGELESDDVCSRSPDPGKPRPGVFGGSTLASAHEPLAATPPIGPIGWRL